MNNDQANFRVRAHALTDKGRRPNNEDFVISFEPTDLLERQKSGCIYIVADGVGGASIGERASKYAAEKVLYEYLRYPEIEPGKRLKKVITYVNHEIFNYAQDKGIRMATTMSVAVVLNNSLIAANVGDSRVYLIRDNEVSQITNDHNIVGELVRNGVMTEVEALKSKAKNRLTRSVGGDEEVHVDIFGPIPLQPKDKILLCSDGLTRYALKENIANLTASGSSEEIAKSLIAFAKDRGHGGADNISVITITYEPTVALDVTIQHPRPKAPEQPLEKQETVYVPKIKSPKPRFGKLIDLLAPGLSFIIITTIVIIVVSGSGVLLLLGVPTPTSLPTIVTNVPTSIPLPKLASQTSSPSPTIPSPTNSPVPNLSIIQGTISCSIGVKIRKNPSTNTNSDVLKNLPDKTHVNIVGVTQNKDEETYKDWYRIKYSLPEGDYWWVWAGCVDVNPTLKSQIQIFNILGTPMK